MSDAAWRPTAPLALSHLRAELYQTIRHFFAQRQVLEVETPVLSAACVPEPTIAPFHTAHMQPLFLQTSPELPMKRLLAAGYGPIFQIAKVFRQGEIGRWHNPEFSLLEWYRPGFDIDQLIQEVDALLQQLLQTPPAEQISYCALFEQQIGLHPLRSPLSTLQAYVAQHFALSDGQDRDTCLQLILSHHIEPHLGHTRPLFVTDFPASQAALARRKATDPDLAARFEVYVQGIELANCFYELTDPVEQRQRFIADLAKRQALNLPVYPLDEHFLAALAHGLPTCAGAALGLDRLLMIKAGMDHIRAVITFPVDNA
jgi:lysyl-tRNA synthetase class 2